MRTRIVALTFASLLAGCGDSAQTIPLRELTSRREVAPVPVIFSSDYGLGILGGATNGPDRHPADVDDAYAVSLALQHTRVQAIVTTFGNAKAAPSAESARRGLSALGRVDADDLVSVGSQGFLDAAPVSFVPSGARPPIYCINAGVERMRDVLESNVAGTITLFAIGPFTDVACLRRAHPDSFAKLAEIIALVGSFDGRPILQSRAVVDFNFAMDPTALGEVIVQSDVPLTLLMFEVTRAGTLGRATLEGWATGGTAAQQYYGRATEPHARYWDAIFTRTDGQVLFDAHTVYYFLNRDAYRCEDGMVAVATVGGYPDTNAATTKNFFTVDSPADADEVPVRGVTKSDSGYTYTGSARGCYAFASPDGTQQFVRAVEASVAPQASSESF